MHRGYTRPTTEVVVSTSLDGTKLLALSPYANGLGTFTSCQVVDECVVGDSFTNPCVTNLSAGKALGPMTVTSPTIGTKDNHFGYFPDGPPVPFGETLTFVHEGSKDVVPFSIDVTMPTFASEDVDVGGCTLGSSAACLLDLSREFFWETRNPMDGLAVDIILDEQRAYETPTVLVTAACSYGVGQRKGRLPGAVLERLHRGRPYGIHVRATRRVDGKVVSTRAEVRHWLYAFLP